MRGRALLILISVLALVVAVPGVAGSQVVRDRAGDRIGSAG